MSGAPLRSAILVELSILVELAMFGDGVCNGVRDGVGDEVCTARVRLSRFALCAAPAARRLPTIL